MKRFGLIALGLWLSLVGLPLLAPTTAHADPEPEVSTPTEEQATTPRDIWSRWLAVEIVGGVDTPYGLIGGAVVVTPYRYIALDAGGGYSRDGGRVAGGARLVLPHANGAFGVRVGFAGGPLTWDTRVPGQPGRSPTDPDVPDALQHRTWNFVGFIDVSLSLEVRFDFGMYLRAWFGVEHALASADRCSEEGPTGTRACTTAAGNPTRTYVGLSLGYAFDL
jgi:hypothetical protein